MLEPKTRKAVILARVSRGERQQDPTSQLIPLRAAAERLGWQVVAEVIEKDSAWDPQSANRIRKQVHAIIERGLADTVMVWAWDRYSKDNIEGSARELRFLEEHLGAQFFSLQEPFLSTATMDPNVRPILLAFFAWIAHTESKRRGERLRAKAVSKREQSGRLGQRGKWGKGYLATPAQVEKVVELLADGQTVRSVAAMTGVSKSQVDRIKKAVPAQAAGQETVPLEETVPETGGGLGQ